MEGLFESLPHREPDRIRELLRLLAPHWQRTPDQRFFQITQNLEHKMGVSGAAFIVDDAQVIAALTKLIAEDSC